MALDDNQNEDVFSNETEPEPESGGNQDEQSNRTFRMMVLGLGAIGALGVLLIALIFLSRQGERNQIAQQNQAIQATNTAIAVLSQVTPTAPPTGTPVPTNTAVSANAPGSAQGKQDLVDTTLAASNFKTLAAALQTAGLTDLLKGPGPFTLFAPTDNAFAQLPAGTLDALMKDPKKLSDVLKYHIVQGAQKVADVAKQTSATTLQGEPVAITASDNSAMVNNAKVTTPDILASNGVIHAIDKVLLPPEMQAGLVPQATAATAGGKPATSVAQVPTRIPPNAATATAAASRGITSTQNMSGTTGTGTGQIPTTGASDLSWLLLAVGLVAVLVVARRLRTSQG